MADGDTSAVDKAYAGTPAETEMETDEDSHYFRTTHCQLALSVLASIGG